MRIKRRPFVVFAAGLGLSVLACPAVFPADEGMGEFKPDASGIGKFKPTTSVPAAGLKAGIQADAPVISGDVDLAPFFKRLEDLGFDTAEIRAVTREIEVFFRAPSGDAEAEWGYILDNLYIPDSFKQEGARKIRYDLKSNEIDTLIHEYTHATRDVAVSEDSPKGTPSHAHYKAVEAIWGNLRSRALLYRYAWMKADEVSGYFMGAAIGSVFEAVEDIVFYNKILGGSEAATRRPTVWAGPCWSRPRRPPRIPGRRASWSAA
ncbi:MAG: hypothetical protein HY748_00490 [Elusimicrobia bacterium]|nr:hypothetical protein [Elusimicrobiota bacterium]